MTAALVAVACSTPLRVEADGALRFHPLLEGLERRTFDWTSPDGADVVPVHAFRVDPRRFRFRVLRATGDRAATVHALARAGGLALAVNGSYFDPAGRPLGLLIDRGRQLQAVRAVDWGIFAVDAAGGARIVHASDWREGEQADAALQAGPRLVVDGKVLALKPQIARRTAVGVDAAGRVILMVTERGMLLADLAALLARPEGEGGLGCRDAMNLDGGPSTQASLFVAGASWDLFGRTGVPVALGVQPREAALGPGAAP